MKCQDKEFKAHKVILAANSDYLAAYNRRQWLETETGMIDLSEDCEPDVLEVALRFMYGRKKPATDVLKPLERAYNLIDVATAADCFGIRGLAEAAT